MSKLNISQGEVQTALEKHFESSAFKLLKWSTISFNEEGKLGFMGDHFRIETIVQRNGQEENVSFFVKTAPANAFHRDLSDRGLMFRKEALFYDQVANKIISILSKARPLDPESKVSVIPRCYLVKDDTLLMEDLHSWNFLLKDASTPLTLDFVVMSIRALARFHAASIALEEQLGKPLIEEFPDLNYETFFAGYETPGHCLATWHAASLDAAQALVPLIEKYKNKPEIIKKAQDALPVFFRELAGKVCAWPDTRNTFCHGDLWTNNILFRLDKAGNPLEAVLVDYQMVRYAPPASDIAIFLMYSFNKHSRDSHSEQVIREYYNELSRTLLDLGVQPEKVLPREELLRTLKEMQKCALNLMIMDYPLVLAPSQLMDPILKDGEKYYQHFLVNRTPFCVKLFHEHETFRYRFTEVMEELVDNYVLKP